jgi:NADH dehydrogenase FAD-containing subunit
MSVQWLWGHVTELCDGYLSVFEGNSGPHVEDAVSSQSCAKYTQVPYDYCVVTVGCQYGLPLAIPKRATPASECLWYPTLLRSSSGFDERLVEQRRGHITSEHAKIKELASRKAHVAIIGAGFVGVEYATELKSTYKELQVSIVESRKECCSTLCENAKIYIQRRLDDMGIISFYDVKYNEMLPPADEIAFWQKLGVPEPERVFMSVGLRPHSRFLPEDCLTDGRRGGWIRVNEKLQIVRDLNNQQEPLFDCRVFAAGNCVGPVPGLHALPKNSFPCEEMAALVAKNVCRSDAGKTLKNFYWPLGASVSLTSLGPRDGVFVVYNILPGSGFVVLRGLLVVCMKEFIRWAKVDECNLGLWGTLIFGWVH